MLVPWRVTSIYIYGIFTYIDHHKNQPDSCRWIYLIVPYRLGSGNISLRIQVCPKKRITVTLQSYCGDGIGTIKPTLGKGMDP